MATSLKQLGVTLLAHALTLPEAWEDHPWGENVAKVGKKVFVFFGVPDPRDEQLIVCVKLPCSGVSALDLGFTEPAGYGMGKHGWVMARITKADAAPLPLLKGWVEESYRAIAPKQLVARLDGAPTPAKKATSAQHVLVKQAALAQRAPAKKAALKREPARRR